MTFSLGVAIVLTVVEGNEAKGFKILTGCTFVDLLPPVVVLAVLPGQFDRFLRFEEDEDEKVG